MIEINHLVKKYGSHVAVDICRRKHHVIDDEQLHHGWRASHDGEVKLADAGIAGITVTPEREKNIGFTDSYADVRQVIMVNSENAEVAGVQHGFLDKFKSCFIDDNRYEYLLQGLGNTLIITFFAIILSVILGTLIAIVSS